MSTTIDVLGVPVELPAGQVGDPERVTSGQLRRRAEWIQQQRLSPAEAIYIPIEYDPLKPYPPAPAARR